MPREIELTLGNGDVLQKQDDRGHGNFGTKGR